MITVKKSKQSYQQNSSFKDKDNYKQELIDKILQRKDLRNNRLRKVQLCCIFLDVLIRKWKMADCYWKMKNTKQFLSGVRLGMMNLNIKRGETHALLVEKMAGNQR